MGIAGTFGVLLRLNLRWELLSMAFNDSDCNEDSDCQEDKNSSTWPIRPAAAATQPYLISIAAMDFGL